MWSSSSLTVVLYPAPESALVSTMSVLLLASLVYLGLSELRGEHLAYSKFWHVLAGRQRERAGGVALPLLPSRRGMQVAYVPALVAAAASFVVPGAVEGLHAQLLSAALAVHFLKRVLEIINGRSALVMFIHRYSGCMPLNTALTISSSYLLNTVIMIYAEYLARGLPEPAVDLLYPGVLVFAVGVAGNLHHHCILSRLRKGGGDKGYKIPRGGLFGLVICPHYLFEIATFFGFAMISQTAFALVFASGTAVYLASRSYATRRWYAAKFEDFPVRIKALVPYVL